MSLSMGLGAAHPWVLLLLPLVLLPVLRHAQPLLAYSSELLLPADPLSSALDGLLRGLAAAAIGALILGLAGLFKLPQAIERVGQGAHMVLLLDRSSSMSRPFAGDRSERNIVPGSVESKARVARRLLSEFVARRNQDMFGMLMFSTNPIQVLPRTDKQPLVQAAIQAGSLGRGLAKTNLGRGLVKALESFADLPYTGSRIILLVSDGGARLDIPTQRLIENLMRRHRVALYWIYIRTQHSPGLDSGLDTATAQDIAPEQLLHRFFQSLEMPYRAYSAENPRALQQAIDDVSRLQNLPIRYQNIIPKRDLSGICYGFAVLLLAPLLVAKLLELNRWRVNER